MSSLRSFARVAAVAALPCTVQTLGAQARPAIRPLGATIATTSDSLGVVSGIRALPGGKLLVNDVSGRRVLLLDEQLKIQQVVADSTPSTANAYGPRPGGLIPFRGDSTLFIDPASLSMLVIDPQGKLGRTMSVPRAQDAGMMSTGASYANGYLVYRGMPNVQMRATGAPGSGGGMPQVQVPDSMPLVRVNLQTRAVDTVANLKIPKTTPMISRVDDKISIAIEINPLQYVDDWAVASNGDVAVVRGQDFHVEWLSSDGQRRTSPKIAFDWKRLTDEDKAQLVDSVGKILEKQFAAGAAGGSALQQGFQSFMGGGMPGGGAMGGAPVMVSMRVDGGSGGAGGPVRAPQITAPKLTVVSPSQLPDYQPPFFAGSTKADADGNLWISTIPTKPQPAGTVYDVVNSKGEVTERVLVPEGRTILGFGPGGIVYLAVRSAPQTAAAAAGAPVTGVSMMIEAAKIR